MISVSFKMIGQKQELEEEVHLRPNHRIDTKETFF